MSFSTAQSYQSYFPFRNAQTSTSSQRNVRPFDGLQGYQDEPGAHIDPAQSAAIQQGILVKAYDTWGRALLHDQSKSFSDDRGKTLCAPVLSVTRKAQTRFPRKCIGIISETNTQLKS